MRPSALTVVAAVCLASAVSFSADTAQGVSRERLVAGLISESKQCNEKGRYAESLKLVDAILVIDPKNEYATAVRVILVAKAAPQQKLQPAVSASYPADWPDSPGRRDQHPAANQFAEQLLAANLPEARFDGVSFSDTIDFLRDTTQVNIFVDWASLEKVGVDRNAPVNCRLKNVSNKTALTKILSSISPPENVGTPDALAMCLDDGVLTIATRRKLYATAATTEVYPIGDLIAARRKAAPGDENGDEANELAKLIKETIAPETWPAKEDDVGGKLKVEGDSLIITQTPDVQANIATLLDKLRVQAKPTTAPNR